MRRRKLVLGIVGVASCCVVLWFAIRHRYESDPQPPFVNSYSQNASAVYGAYEQVPVEADKLFTGKALELCDWQGSGIRTDEAGKSYISVYRIVDWTKHPIPEEVIRCYLHRPEDPVMERGLRHLPFGAQGYDIKGVCMGKIGGIIIMKKCYLVEVSVEGPDW